MEVRMKHLVPFALLAIVGYVAWRVLAPGRAAGSFYPTGASGRGVTAKSARTMLAALDRFKIGSPAERESYSVARGPSYWKGK
jgi:hypothetical protein